MPDRSVAPATKDFSSFEIFLPPYEKTTLKNGVPLYYVNGGAEDVVKIEWLFKAGNSYEDKTGIASAAADLIKNGTSSKSAFEINRQIEFYGAFLQTGSYHESSVITLQTLTKRLKETLPVVQELLSDAIFPEQELSIYSQNVIQRMKVNLQKCEYVAGREIVSLLYGKDHPYGRRSSIADIEAITREDLVDFYQKNFLHGDCKIFASGKLPDNFIPLMEELFGTLDIGNERSFPEFEMKPGEPKKYVVSNDPNGVQTAIRIARSFPNRRHPDFKEAMVLNVILGGYFGSRLMANIREDKGFTYGIYSYIESQIQSGAWLISTEAGKDVAEAAISESFKELQNLCDEPVDDEELSLVKNYLIGQQLASLDGPFQIMDRWKNLIFTGLDESFFYSVIETIKTVSPEQLQAMAKKYFDPKAYFVLSVT